MTCRSCGFNNMKNASVCARCGAKLRWEGPVRRRDFVPGRSGFLVRLNRWLDHAPAPPVRETRRRRGFRALVHAAPKRNILWWILSIAPGLGHIVQGRRVRGLAILGAWACLFALAVSAHPERIVIVGAPIATTLRRMAFTAIPGIMALVHLSAFLGAIRTADFCDTAAGVWTVVAVTTAFVLALYGMGIYFSY
jgi:hypothetical protein